MNRSHQRTGSSGKKWIRRFAQGDSGVATIEAILWFPLFFFMLFLVVEGSIVFNKQTMAMRVVQDVNRSAAVGVFPTDQSAEQALLARIHPISPNAQVNTRFENGLTISSVQMPVRNLSGLGFFGKNTNFNVSVSSQQLLER